VGKPLPFDVVPEGDLTKAPVVPGPRENLLLLAVGSTQRLATGRVSAGRALVSVRVTVDACVLSAAGAAPFEDPGHRDLFPDVFLLACGQFVGKRCRMAVDQCRSHWTGQYPSDQVFYRSLALRGEAVSKPKIKLITQRSQVQILSPLLSRKRRFD
jgi:hypothetical protein